MKWFLAISIILVVIAVFAALFSFLILKKNSTQKQRFEKQSLKIREEILAKEQKIQNLAEKEREFLANFDKIKEKKEKEIQELTESFYEKQEFFNREKEKKTLEINALEKEVLVKISEQEKETLLKLAEKKEKEIQEINKMKAEEEKAFNQEKERRTEELNEFFKKRSFEIQEELNNVRLKQEKEIEIELKEKKQKALEIFLEELDQEKKKISISHDEEIKLIKDEIESLRALEDAARMARERDLKELDKKRWHMITFSKEDLEELKELNAITLRNPLPLKKAIYDIYYKEPVRALLNRVLGEKKISGIYKITLVSTGQAYVGKSVDVHRRWQEHIKRGMGAEIPTQSIIYVALEEHGIDNFTFELIEEVDAAKLNERESYWIDYFGTKIFGFNMRG